MSLFDRFNLGEGFSRYFEVLSATTDELRNDVYRIRHEVYCEELGFEPVRPDRRETDVFDRHSVHCLLRSASETHELVGCTRMVLANPDERDAPCPSKPCAATPSTVASLTRPACPERALGRFPG